MSEFHEEFEGPVAATASSPEVEAAVAEPETPDVDAAGAGSDASPDDPAAPAGLDDPDLEGDAEASAGPEGEAAPDAAAPEHAAPEAAALEAEPTPEDKAAQYLALAQRTQADFENYKKRAARDAALAQQRGVTKLVKELLPAVDNLERAISHAAAEDPLLEGIKFVLSDLLAAFGRSGIESFDPAGETFDPTVHEAVAQFPKEGVDPGTVVEVYQQGYRLGETVLRPARVVVSA